MKKTYILILSFIFVFIIFAWLKTSRTNHHTRINYNDKSQQTSNYSTNSFVNERERNIRIPDLQERRLMSRAAKLELLEKLGYVPPGFEMPDVLLAEHTSWWGKRLDPVEFWTNRVLWLDDSADFSARSRGRAYPPMPYDDLSLSNRSDVDEGGKSGYASLDGGRQPGYVLSDREMIFWHNFTRTHPRPPANIQRWIGGEADTWLRYEYIRKNDPIYAKRLYITQKSMEESLEHVSIKTKYLWFPQECVTTDAYYWDHVMRKRAEYEERVSSKRMEDEGDVKRFFNNVYVDHELITEPLTDEQIDAANAWKVAYLNRLRTEKWDESYINAYLKAWNLTEEYVFGKMNEKK